MSPAIHQTIRSPSPGPSDLAYRILLVEDHEAIRNLSAQALTRTGYKVDTAGDGLSGWEALQTHHYDLLITDNQMPGLSGFELVRMLRSAKMTLPIILASGGMNSAELSQNQWLQPAVTLPKPFTTEQMLETVAEALPTSARVPDNAPNPLDIYLPSPAEMYAAEMGSHSDAWLHWGINE